MHFSTASTTLRTLVLAHFLAIVSPATLPLQSDGNDLRVVTTSGLLNGFVNSSAPSVRQFLGIPYALPPTGPRRWLPAQNFTSSASISTTDIGSACPQHPLRNNWVYSVNGGNKTEFFPQENYSEDCLTLNVWTPDHLPSNASLPVIVFFFGGRFVEGATNAPIYNPQSWIQRTQEHIVVTVNFRMNVLGFPNAEGLKEQNLGLLDQRFATEWLRTNIGAFGGNASRMVVWGESAGAIAIDYLNFAYAEDPIYTGMILDSGTAHYLPAGAQSQDYNHDDFRGLIQSAGCSKATSPIDCMRDVPWQTLQGMLAMNTTKRFQAIADERIVYSDYGARYGQGNVSRIPAMIGTNQRELSATTPQPLGTPLDTNIDIKGNVSFLCAAVNSSTFREEAGLTTYRFRYDGAWPNINPVEYPGAFHAAELPMIFGLNELHGATTPYQRTVSEKMQDLWLEFVKDPEHGLEKAGWGSVASGEAVLLGGAQSVMEVVDVEEIDLGCERAIDALEAMN